MGNYYELLPSRSSLRAYSDYYYLEKPSQWPKIDRLMEYADCNIRLIPFEGSEKLKRDTETPECSLDYPPVIYFSGDFNTLKDTDYPIVDTWQLPIVSKYLLDVIAALAPFRYHTVPVTILDFLGRQPFFLSSGELKGSVKRTTNYVYLKIIQYVSLDRDSSDYFFRGKEINIRKLEIIEPYEGLDPIFRVWEQPGKIFVTQETRYELERKKVKGIHLFDGDDFVEWC